MSLSAAIAMFFSLASGMVYLRAIYRRETRPSIPANLVFIVAVATAVVSGSLPKAGLSESLALAPGIASLITLASFIAMSIIRKTGHFEFTRFDWICLSGVAISLPISWFSQEAIISLLAATAIEVAGVTLVLAKLLRDRGSESVLAWGLSGTAYLVPILFSGRQDLTVMNTIFSAVYIIMASLVVGLVLVQRCWPEPVKAVAAL